MTAFKRSEAKYVRKSHKTANWREYEADPRQRSSLDSVALRGRAQRLHLGLRQAEGFLRQNIRSRAGFGTHEWHTRSDSGRRNIVGRVARGSLTPGLSQNRT